MKMKFLSLFSKILSFLLIFLGFSACDGNDDDGGGTVCMYGTPTAKFIVKGQVVDEENNAVSGLKVALGKVYSSYGNPQSTYYIDSINTDAKGKFNLTVGEFPKDQKFVIKYEDTDAEQKGKLGITTDTVRFEKPKFVNGDNSWYAGETTKDLGVVKIGLPKQEE